MVVIQHRFNQTDPQASDDSIERVYEALERVYEALEFIQESVLSRRVYMSNPRKGQ